MGECCEMDICSQMVAAEEFWWIPKNVEKMRAETLKPLS